MHKFTFAAAIALSALTAASPAFAEGISTGQWYSAGFGTDVPSGVGTPFNTATDGPLPGGGTQNSVAVTDGPNYTINMAAAGYVVVTDLQTSGDEFNILVNTVAGTPTSNNLTPSGQTGLPSGNTSVSCHNCTSAAGEDIGAALGDAEYSSGTFFLPEGADTITITYEGSIGNGDVAFYADSAAPEPGTILLFGSALAGLGMLRRRKKA